MLKNTLKKVKAPKKELVIETLVDDTINTDEIAHIPKGEKSPHARVIHDSLHL